MSGTPLVASTSDGEGRPDAVTFGPDTHPGLVFHYDEFGRISETEGPDGHYLIGYDSQGRLAQRRTADGSHTWSYIYDAAGHLTGVEADCSRRGRVSCDSTTVRYDDAGRVTRQSGPAGVEERTYDRAGRIRSVRVDGVTWTVTKRTAAGRPLEIRGPFKAPIKYQYDGQGRVTSITSPGGVVTRYKFSGADVAAVERGGMRISFRRDAAGRITKAVDAFGIYTYGYDGHGRLTSADGPGIQEQFTYDATGRLRSAAQGDAATTFSYDQIGRVTKVTQQSKGSDDRSVTYRYDRGRLVTAIPDGGDKTTITYGNDGRPSVVKVGDKTEHWTWSATGLLRTVTAGEDTYTYDYTKNRLTRITKNGQDQIASVVHRDQRIDIAVTDAPKLSTAWNSLGAITSVRSGGDPPLTMRHGPDGEITQMKNGDETPTTIDWQDGIPAAIATESGKVQFGCDGSDCTVTSTLTGAEKQTLNFADGVLTSAKVADRTIGFTADASGGITGANDANPDDAKRKADWKTDFTGGKWQGHFGDDLQKLVGTDQRFLQGLSITPGLPEIPSVAAVPSDLAPAETPVALPDVTMGRQVALLVPSPPTQRMRDLGDTKAWSRALLNELVGAPTATVQIGSFVADQRSLLAANDENDWMHGADVLDKSAWGGQYLAIQAAFGPDPSVWEQVLDFGKRLVPLGIFALGVAAEFLPLPARFIVGAAVGLAAVASCTIGWGPCVELALTSAALLLPAVGNGIKGLFASSRVAAASAITATEAVAVGETGARTTGPLISRVLSLGDTASERFCQIGRVVCYSATRFPETAPAYEKHLGRRWDVFRLDRAGGPARRAEALADTPTRPLLDRDEFPFAFTRQGGKGALVTFVSPFENRSAGGYLGQSVRHLPDQKQFLFVLTELPNQTSATLTATGAAIPLAAYAQRN